MEFAWAAETVADRAGGSYWQLVIIVAAIGFLGFFARWRKSRGRPLPTAREMRARDEEPNRYRDAADRAIVELLETSRTLNAQVDNKIRILNRLVKEAEEHGARLEALLARAGGVDAPGYSDGRAPPEPRTTAAERPKFISDLHERIYRLRQDGKSSAEIARATNLSITEVEFIVTSFWPDRDRG